MRRVVEVKVVKINEDGSRHVKYPLFVLEGKVEKMLQDLACGSKIRPGDFIIFPFGKVFRRRRGRFEETSLDGYSELISSQIAGEGVEDPDMILPNAWIVSCMCTLKVDVLVRSIREYTELERGAVLAEEVKYVYILKRGAKRICQKGIYEELHSLRSPQEPLHTLIEKRVDMLSADCIQKEDLNPIIIHRPKEPLHDHTVPTQPHPMFGWHPIFRRHKKQML